MSEILRNFGEQNAQNPLLINYGFASDQQKYHYRKLSAELVIDLVFEGRSALVPVLGRWQFLICRELFS